MRFKSPPRERAYKFSLLHTLDQSIYWWIYIDPNAGSIPEIEAQFQLAK